MAYFRDSKNSFKKKGGRDGGGGKEKEGEKKKGRKEGEGGATERERHRERNQKRERSKLVLGLEEIKPRIKNAEYLLRNRDLL